MKIFIRIVMVLVLLGSLGYGSYAFGRYVLTNKLFGEANGPIRSAQSNTEATAVTHHTNWQGDKPRVEVKVMPAGGDGPATEITDSSTKTIDSLPANSGEKTVRKTFDNASVEYSLGDESGTRRHRRKRDKLKTDEATSKVEAGDEKPAREENVTGDEKPAIGDENSSESGDSSSISVSAEGDRSTEASPAPTEKPRKKRNRRKRRHSEESPVPKPESSGSSSSSSSDSGSSSSSSSSGGGDSADISPVPKPE